MMMPPIVLWILGLAVATGIGFFLTTFFWPNSLPRPLIWAFAPSVGVGICSLIFVVFRRPMFTVEFVLLAVLAVAWFFSPKHSPMRFPKTLQLPVAVLLLLCVLGWTVAGMMFRLDRMPHGDWDSWNIWNNHARYLYRDGQNWKNDITHSAHSDYPLLLPASTARLWRYAGTETQQAGGALDIVLMLSGISVLAGTLAALRDTRIATLTGLILIATPFFAEYAVSMSADVPLSVFILSTIALVCFERTVQPDHPRQPGLLVLAGLMAGFAAWTKNEGILFVVCVSVALAVPIFLKPKDTLRRLSAFAAGAVLPLAVLLWFKVAVAPPNDITGFRKYEEVVQKLVSPERYAVIWHTFSDNFWTFGGWAISPAILFLVYVCLRGIDRTMLRNPGWLHGVFVSSALLAGYFAVYVVTPMDLRWHLDSSLPRLYLHIWPSFLLLAGLVGRIDTGSSAG